MIKITLAFFAVLFISSTAYAAFTDYATFNCLSLQKAHTTIKAFSNGDTYQFYTYNTSVDSIKSWENLGCVQLIDKANGLRRLLSEVSTSSKNKKRAQSTLNAENTATATVEVASTSETNTDTDTDSATATGAVVAADIRQMLAFDIVSYSVLNSEYAYSSYMYWTGQVHCPTYARPAWAVGTRFPTQGSGATLKDNVTFRSDYIFNQRQWLENQIYPIILESRDAECLLTSY